MVVSPGDAEREKSEVEEGEDERQIRLTEGRCRRLRIIFSVFFSQCVA